MVFLLCRGGLNYKIRFCFYFKILVLYEPKPQNSIHKTNPVTHKVFPFIHKITKNNSKALFYFAEHNFIAMKKLQHFINATFF